MCNVQGSVVWRKELSEMWAYLLTAGEYLGKVDENEQHFPIFLLLSFG